MIHDNNSVTLVIVTCYTLFHAAKELRSVSSLDKRCQIHMHIKVFSWHSSSLWQWLIEPSTTISKTEDRRRVRLLVGILLTAFVLTVPGGFLSPNAVERVILGTASLLFLAAYIFARTQYYRVAKIISIVNTLFIPAVSSFFFSYGDPNNLTHPLMWLTIAVLMGALWLSLKGFVLLMFVEVATIAYVSFFTSLAAFPDFLELCAFLLLSMALICVTALIQAQDQKQIEEQSHQLLESQRYVQNVINSMADSLIVINPDSSTIHTVNQATLSLLDYTEQELIGKPINTILDDQHEPYHEKNLEHIIQQGSVQNLEHTYLSKTGTRIPIFLSEAVMRNTSDTMQRIVWVAKDITERKQIEESLEQHREWLEVTLSSIGDGLLRQMKPV